MFRTNPRQLIIRLVRNSYGYDAKVRVNGNRLSQQQADERSLPCGTYYTEVTVNELVVAFAHAKDWRDAYEELKSVINAVIKERKAVQACSTM